MKALVLLLSVFLFHGALANRKSYRGYQIIGVEAKNIQQLDVLKRIEKENEDGEVMFFTGPWMNHETSMLVSPKVLGSVKRDLSRNHMATRIKSQDAQVQIDAEAASLKEFNRNTIVRESIYENYLTYTQINDWFKMMANAYPNNIRYSALNENTSSNNPIPWVKVYKDSGVTKPAIIVECLTHAREWVTGSICMGLVDKMLSRYEVDNHAKVMLDSFDWYLAPVHNPDGYIYSHTSNRYWRKNRRRVSGACYGVDLNRNWDIDHGVSGSSTSACGDTYPGGMPFSEVETTGLMSEAMLIMESQGIAGFFSFHCYSQLLLLPFAYTTSPPADIAQLKSVGEAAMAELRTVENKIFRVEAPYESLYLASGGAYDWFKLGLGVPFSYTYEVRPVGSGTLQDFVLPSSEIPNSIQEAYVSMGVFAQKIGETLKK